MKNAKDYIDNFKSANTFKPTESTLKRDIDAEVLNLLANGNKLAAVKLYKDTTGLGLSESKDHIDKLQGQGLSSASDSFAPTNWSSSSKRRDSQIDDLLKAQNSQI